MTSEKRATYKASSSYTTCNAFGPKTKNIWIVFHGMGYLSRYFARYFSGLDPEQNFIIIPQAPSKYYIGPENKHVGASWLTREDTVEETKNVLAYIDAVWASEMKQADYNFIVMGYSQGVSIATRWISSRKMQCHKLLLHSGGIPKELTAADFDYLNENSKVCVHYGSNDPFINSNRKIVEEQKAKKLFGSRLTISTFEGTHEVDANFLQKFLLL